MPNFPTSSYLGWLGLFFLIFGIGLSGIAIGIGDIRFGRPTVNQGRKTLVFGVILIIAGIIFLYPNIYNEVKEFNSASSTVKPPTTMTPTPTMTPTTAIPTLTPTPILIFEDDFQRLGLNKRKWKESKLTAFSVEDDRLNFDFTNTTDKWTSSNLYAQFHGVRATEIEFDIAITGGESLGLAGFTTSCDDSGNSTIGLGLGIGWYELYYRIGHDRVDLNLDREFSFGKVYSFHFEQVNDNVIVKIDDVPLDTQIPCTYMGEWFTLIAGGTPGSSISGFFDNVRLNLSPLSNP